MTTWNVTVELLVDGKPWPHKEIKLWIYWPIMLGGSSPFAEYTDSSGHAEFSIEDIDGKFDDNSVIQIRVKMDGEYHQFDHALGEGAITVSLDSGKDSDEENEDEENEDDNDDEDDDEED